MAVPNVVSDNLIASVSDHLQEFVLAPNIPFIPISVSMKKTDQDLIRKYFSLIIFQLTGIKCYQHLT